MVIAVIHLWSSWGALLELGSFRRIGRMKCMSREHRHEHAGKGRQVEAGTTSTTVGKSSLTEKLAVDDAAQPDAVPRVQLSGGPPVTAHAASNAAVDGTNYSAKLASHIDPRVLQALAKADASSLASLTMDITAGNWKGVAIHFGQKLAPKALEAFARTASKSGVIKALGEIGGKLGKFLGPLASVADALINADDAGSPQEVNIEEHIMPAEGVAYSAGVAAGHNRDAAKHLSGGKKTAALLDALDDDKARLVADAAAALYSNGHGFERNPGRDAKTAATREKQDEAAYLAYVGGGYSGRT